MGKNQNSVVVLQIRLKFWWMIPNIKGPLNKAWIASP